MPQCLINSAITDDAKLVGLIILHYLAQQILTGSYCKQYRWLGQGLGRSAENMSLCLYLDDGGCDDDGCNTNHREIFKKRFVKKILLLGCATHRLVFFSFNTPKLIKGNRKP